MTQEEKAKAYDEALKVLHKYDGANIMFSQSLKEEMFPELKECEDLRITKAIKYGLDHVFTNNTTVFEVTKEQCLAWLEKQCEHANFRNKIQIGDKVTRNEDSVLVNLSQLNRVAKKQGEQKPIVNDNAKEMFIKALERVEEQNAKGYKLTDCDKNSWWEDFKNYTSCTIEQKPADKAEPKFKVDDWVVYKDNIWKICNISLKTYYELLKINNEVSTRLIKDVDKAAHLWTIQDARNGDILVNGTILIMVDHLGTFENRPIIYSWYFADSEKFHGIGPTEPDRWEVKGFIPATKEQRDLLFQKIKEAGYKWDAEKKELKKIEQNSTDEIGNYDHEKVLQAIINEQKPAWSEEDEYNAAFVIETLLGLDGYEEYMVKLKRMANWLKSLKDRVQPKQEWNEEDDSRLKEVLYYIEYINRTNVTFQQKNLTHLINWLKSLRPQK